MSWVRFLPCIKIVCDSVTPTSHTLILQIPVLRLGVSIMYNPQVPKYNVAVDDALVQISGCPIL